MGASTVAGLALATLVFACAGAVRDDASAAADACDQADGPAHDAGEEDAGPSWWVDVFDATLYSGFDPPLLGEYPPSGSSACVYSGCFLEGTCDPQSGWCCSGKAKEGRCACGAEAGCVPPSVCCAVPGALQLQCVATPDDCPDAR